MEVKNLDTDYLKHSNDKVFTTLRYIFQLQEPLEKGIPNILIISELLNYITDLELLLGTVKYLKNANLLCEYDDVFSKLNNSVFKELQYSENDIVRILSFVVSGLLEYEIYSMILRELGVTDFESFKYGIDRREVQILNLNALKNKVKKTNAKSIISKSERLNPKDSEGYLYKIINSLILIKYDKETSIYDSEIELYKNQLGLINILNFPIPKAVKEKGDYDKYKTLKDIFKNNDDFERCVNELRTAIPKIINEKRKYLLGTKKIGSVVAWVDALYFKGLIIKPKDDVLASLLVEFFDDFSISGRSLRANQTKAYDQYYNHFRNALSQPKK